MTETIREMGCDRVYCQPRFPLALLQVAVDVECGEAVDRRHCPGDRHDVTGVVDGGLAEGSHAVAAWIVLLFHHHVKRAILREESDGLVVPEALLRAIAMLFSMLAHFQVAGEIDDLADHGL